MQFSHVEVNTHTFKVDGHFLLVDGKVGLKEDAENDPCDLHREKKRRKAINLQDHCWKLSLVNYRAEKLKGQVQIWQKQWLRE